MKLIFFISSFLFTLLSFGQQLTKNIYFEVDEFKLTADAKKTLDELLPSIQNKTLEIIGYADSTGSVAYNLTCSKKRAQSVSEYLILKGINGENLKPLLAKGETTIAPTLSQNRRVTITAYNENLIHTETQEDEPLSKTKDEPLPKTKDEPLPKTKDEPLPKTKDGVLNQETMDKIKVGDILNVGGLEFHPGRHFLKSYSMPFLDNLTNLLLDNPDVKIEIQGHICCQLRGDGLDKDTGKQNLSENRAEMVFTELIKRGVPKDRLTYKGYGASRKVEEEINAEAMQRNRRVSILIIEK